MSVVIVLLLIRRRREGGEQQPSGHEPLSTSDWEPRASARKKKTPTVAPARSKPKLHHAALKRSAEVLLHPEEPMPVPAALPRAREARAPPEGDEKQKQSAVPASPHAAFESALHHANQRVRVHRLRSEPQHNGEEGVAIGKTDTPDGPRWNIRCFNGARLSLKPKNLEPVLPE